MSKNFSGKFPDGTPTTSAKAYLGAWEQLSEPIEKEFGLQRVAFDPGLLFRDEAEPRLTVELPVWLALRMVKVARRGTTLAMRVLQSDLYRQLDDEERADCDALLPKREV